MTELRLAPDEWPGAIADTDGRQLVVAGPGTGKTEFLVRRVAHLLRDGRAAPREIVVLSFSRRASARMRARIEAEREETGAPVEVATFHSLALRLLESARPGDRPIPLTTPEQVSLVRTTLGDEDPADWPPLYQGILTSQVFSAEVADFLLRCSERLLTPSDLARLASDRADWRGLPGLYERYLARLADLGRTDYGVLLTQAVEVLRSEFDPGFRYVLVDEYQDTSLAQATMAQLLAVTTGNLTVAGDPYQSIFSFRGAELRNVADFGDEEETKKIILDRSTRVPAEIMEAALRVVASGDLPGSAGPVRPADHPGRCETYVFDQETAEAEWIAQEIEHLMRVESVPASRIAVLVRSKRELIHELSRALSRRSVPHDPPEARLVDHPAVRLIQDLVTVAARDRVSGPNSLEGMAADQAMRRILLGPLVGLSVGEERDLARERAAGPARWCEVVARRLPDLTGLAGLLIEPAWATEAGAADGFWEAWARMDGLPALVHDPGRAEWRRAWTAFGQMVGRQAERDPTVSLARFFEMVEEEDFEASPLISHRPDTGRVSLTTLHQAKGLEFDVVFIANAVEGVFPDLRRSRRMLRPELLSPERTSDPDAQHMFQVQEEMRLAYTAMTRAVHRVVWTATDAGVDQGERRPSRFLLAAAGSARPAPPAQLARDPVTIREAETWLRRMVLDTDEPTPRRLAAARVLGAETKAWDARLFAGAARVGPSRPVLAPSFRLSPSQAQSYEDCPRRYVLERRLRLGDSTSPWAHFGELAHRVLEIVEAEVIGSGRRHGDLERVIEVTDHVWDDDAAFGSPELDAAWKAKAIEMFTRLYERWPGRGDPVAVELEVETEIEGVRWIGRVDRLERGDEGLRVVDYKSGTSVPTQDQAAESLQLGFYALAVARSQGEVVASEMWFPRVKSKSVTTRSLAMHRVDELSGRLTEITNSIRSEDWEPRVGASCARCPFRRSCPAWPEGRGAFLA